jgi:uncharacterized sulfatase
MLRTTFAFAFLAATLLRAAPPNVVLIISDDHGWADYGFMGHPAVKTPNIDKLASQSLTFTRGYVPTSLCRPSLASIMTGRYPHEHRITGNDPPGDPRSQPGRAAMVDVFRASKTIASLLTESGYVGHQSGKWWEGQCTCCGFTACMTHGDVARGGRHGDDGLKIGRESMQPIYDFLDKNQGKPFFLWYAPFLPHTPHNPPERLLAKYQAPGRPLEIAKYWAMIEWLDETVGDLMAHLDKRGLASNTVVVYLADNGWVQLTGRHALYDTRAKLSPYDAGLRTPILVRWPGKITPRRDGQTVVSSIDIAPTVLAAAGIRPDPNMTGVNLTDTRRLAARPGVFGSIFVHTSLDIANPKANLKYRWMVQGRFKLIAPHAPNLDLPVWENQPQSAWGRTVELYDILADPGERKDLAATDPTRVRKLLADLDRWWTVTR